VVALNSRVLIVSDGTLRVPPVTPGVSFDVLGLGRDAISWQEDLCRLVDGRTDVQCLDVEPWSEDVSRAVREFLVPLIDQMPDATGPQGRPLGDLLATAHGRNAWWYLEISEKSPLRGTFVRSLYHLGLIQRAVRERAYTSVHWLVRDARLRRAFESSDTAVRVDGAASVDGAGPDVSPWRYWAQAMRATAHVFGVRLIARLARWPNDAVTGTVRIFTLFPHWWLAPYSEAAADRFFPKATSTSGDRRVGYLMWWSGDLRSAWRFRHRVRTVATKERMTLLQLHVGMRTLLSLYSVRLFRRLLAFRRLVAGAEWPRFEGCDVRPLLDREIARSIGSGELALDRLLESSVRRALMATPARALVFRFEGQPIDRALTAAARGVTRAIGFWHSAIALCPNYLPFWFGAGALAPAAAAGRVAPMPMPDAMLATERICEETLTRQGFPAEAIARCGPVRHVDALSVVRRAASPAEWRHRHSLPVDGLVVMIATSVVATDATAMLKAVTAALPQVRPRCVLVRVHPARPLPDDVWTTLELAAAGAELRRVSSAEHLYELMAASDVVVTGGSTFAFEAIALGVMPILFESPGDFSASSFAPFEQACFVVRNERRLSAALQDVTGQSAEWSRRVAEWPALCRDVFGDLSLDPAERFASALAALTRERAC
jgi:surface carbohydrate biosynthesis protein (TIGR04326 family)